MRNAVAVLLVLFAAKALPAAPDPHRKQAEDAYILAIGETWSSGGSDLDDLVRMRGRVRGDFRWFRRAGKAYRVTDAATLAKADAFFVPLRALEPELEDFRSKERRLDARGDELDREEELIEQDIEDIDADIEAGMAVNENDLENLESRRAAVRLRMRELEKEQRKLESVERDLDARQDSLEAEAEAKLWRLIDETIASGTAKGAPS